MSPTSSSIAGEAQAAPAVRPSAIKTILLAGLAGGLGDILYAFTVWGIRGVSPVRISQSIAGGWLGRDAAVAGGIPTAILGLASHFGICIGAAALYYAVAVRWRYLVDHPYVSAVVFGIGMYIAMVYVIVPLSAAPGGFPKFGWNMAVALFPHIFLVGIPFALITRRALRQT
jgi:hypothetical protein